MRDGKCLRDVHQPVTELGEIVELGLAVLFSLTEVSEIVFGDRLLVQQLQKVNVVRNKAELFVDVFVHQIAVNLLHLLQPLQHFLTPFHNLGRVDSIDRVNNEHVLYDFL